MIVSPSGVDWTLILRLEAPLMSFGGPQVDHIGATRRFPGLAQIAGLLANALGFSHGDAERLQRLQARVRFASLLLRPGEDLRDYHTVDLGQPHLASAGWTTRGRAEHRKGGEAATSTHIRERYYRADSSVLVALRLDPEEEAPTLVDVEAALEQPARPLFIGRKTCLPAAPLVAGRVATSDLRDALTQALSLPSLEHDVEQACASARRMRRDFFEAELPTDSEALGTIRVVDARDWRNQFHGGERIVMHGAVPLPAIATEEVDR